MPLVMHGAGAGLCGQPTLQLAVDDARLMLPYLAFAGPVTVMMALLNAQGRFALTAFSPLLFNLALIGAMLALMLLQLDDHRRRAGDLGDGRHRRLAAAADARRRRCGGERQRRWHSPSPARCADSLARRSRA